MVRMVHCDDVYVEVSVLVSSEFNESNLYENLFHPNASRLNMSDGTGNATHASNNSSWPPGSVPFIPGPFMRFLSISPILCVIGFDYKCFNDTNVTRVADYTVDGPTTSSQPVGYIVGTGAAVLVVVALSVVYRNGFKRRPIPVEKRPVTAVVIDWPPRPNKKQNPESGAHYPMHINPELSSHA